MQIQKVNKCNDQKQSSQEDESKNQKREKINDYRQEYIKTEANKISVNINHKVKYQDIDNKSKVGKTFTNKLRNKSYRKL